MSVFTRLQKKADAKWTQQQLDDKLLKWNESCWKAVVYVIFSTSAFLVAHREPWFKDPHHFWSGATQFPLDSYVPFKISLFYLLEIGFYIQVRMCGSTRALVAHHAQSHRQHAPAQCVGGLRPGPSALQGVPGLPPVLPAPVLLTLLRTAVCPPTTTNHIAPRRPQHP